MRIIKAGLKWGRRECLWLIILANILALAPPFPKRGWETVQGECVSWGSNFTEKSRIEHKKKKKEKKSQQGTSATPLLLLEAEASAGGSARLEGEGFGLGAGLQACGNREFRVTNFKATLMCEITLAPFFSRT